MYHLSKLNTKKQRDLKNMNKEEMMLQKRLIELSRIAYQRGIVTFSDFLNLNELNILHTIPKAELYSQYVTFGGYEHSERQMVAFLPDALCYEYEYPISIIKVTPSHKKFADSLSHRDYLGAILNLGMERCKIGDILVEETGAFIFVHSSMEQFVLDEFRKVKHTTMDVRIEPFQEFQYEPKRKEIRGSVSSVRLDSLLALAFSSSRSKLTAYIENGKVFVNGKLVTSNGYQIKENDIVSVRGLGRFQFQEILSQTKKGRYYAVIQLYI